MIRNALLGLIISLCLPAMLSAQFTLNNVDDLNTRVTDFDLVNPPINGGYFYLFGDGHCSFQEDPVHKFRKDMAYSVDARVVEAYTPSVPSRIVQVPTAVDYATQPTGLPVGSNTSFFYMGGNMVNLDKSWDASPGFELIMMVSFTHPSTNSGDPSISGDIELHFDQYLSFVDNYTESDWANWNGVVSSGLTNFSDKATWSYQNLEPGETRYLYAEFIVDLNAPKKILTRAEMTTDYMSGCDPSFCFYSRNRPMWRTDKPKDPNIMRVEQDCIKAESTIGQELNYFVKFQNEGEGPANNVVLDVSLDENITLSDIVIDSSSAPCTFALDPVSGNLIILFSGIGLPGLRQTSPHSYLPHQTEGYAAFTVCSNDFHVDGTHITGITKVDFDGDILATNSVQTLAEVACPYGTVCGDYIDGGDGDNGDTGGDGGNEGGTDIGNLFDGDLSQTAPVSVYPNPFSQELNLDYEITQTNGEQVKIKLINSLGRETSQVLVNNFHAPGIYHQQFDLSGFPAGMYILVIEQGSQLETRKLMKF